MNQTIEDFKQILQKTTLALKEEIRSVRGGRATPSLVENLLVETYGCQTKLKLMELATIAMDAPSILAISPFDQSTTQDIEKAVLKSQLGLTPRTQGTKILLSIPPLSQEQREKITKLIGQTVEEKKEIIRNHRDEARKKTRNSFERKEITEDEKFRTEKEIDNLTHQTMEEINQIKERKEKEIMEV